MGNPNLEVTLDFILADDTPVFVDKCVTQTHGGSHLQYFKEATNSPRKLQYLFPRVQNRLELWNEMFERDGVTTVGGVLSELYDEETLLHHLGKGMEGWVDYIAESPIVKKKQVRKEEKALEEFHELKKIHQLGVKNTEEKKYSLARRTQDKLYHDLRSKCVKYWKNSELFVDKKNGDRKRKIRYADQQLVGATLYLSGRQKKKSALLTADFGIREYYDLLLEEQPALWKNNVKEPIEVFCFRKPEFAPIGADKDILEMTTYFVDDYVRQELPVEEMRSESKEGILYRRTG